VWLQNIDSRDLAWKISGIRILRAFERQKQIPYGNDNKKGNSKGKSTTAKAKAEAAAKAKGRAIAWPSL